MRFFVEEDELGSWVEVVFGGFAVLNVRMGGVRNKATVVLELL